MNKITTGLTAADLQLKEPLRTAVSGAGDDVAEALEFMLLRDSGNYGDQRQPLSEESRSKMALSLKRWKSFRPGAAEGRAEQMSDDTLRAIAYAVGMETKDGVTLRSAGHAGGITAEDGFAFARAAIRAGLAAAASEPDQRLRNLQTWLVCREIGNALQPALTTVQGWVAALSPLTGQPAPAFLMQASDPAEVAAPVALCIEQLDLWAGRLEAAIDRTAHEQLGQHANDEPAAGGRDPMEQLP